MSDPIDSLKNKWDAVKSTPSEPKISSKELISLAKKKMKSAVMMHVGNIGVLAITLIGISAFFIYVAPLKNTLSHIGIFLMVGGLAIRIIIECYSIYRSSHVDVSESVAIANDTSLQFYNYRKRIHGPITVVILIAYTIGFYLLTPEFSDYFTTIQVILMDVSYLGAAAIFIYSIRKAIQKEMKLLDELKLLQNEFE
ncbi:MAG: hypothetical protein ABJG47_16860 [Ekhidna sp.]